MEAHNNWEDIDIALDIMELLSLIQACMAQKQTWKQEDHTLADAEAKVFKFFQGRFVSNKDYKDKFKDLVNIAEQYGSIFGQHPKQIKSILAKIA